MSQPFDRGCRLSPPGEPDPALGEFWVESPWEIAARHNLSSFERNRLFLNVQGENFLDASRITTADSDGDARCAVPADVNGDGRQDLLVRQVGGGALLLYENQFPQQHYLTISLWGERSNRLGIGTRIEAEVDGLRIIRELYPANTYRSQAPAEVHLGLGEAEQVDRLTLMWPSGVKQVLRDVAADRHIVIDEKTGRVAAFEQGGEQGGPSAPE